MSAVRKLMTDSSTTEQSDLLRDDEAASIAEALLSANAPTVASLASKFEAAGSKGKPRRNLTQSIAGSVFGQPEPGPPAPGSQATNGSPMTIYRAPATAPPVAGNLAVANIMRTGVEEDARWRKITIVLAALFVVCLLGSIVLTAIGFGSAEADTDPVTPAPTVDGTIQTTTIDSQPPTTPAPTSVVAPPTTAPTSTPTTTEPPTTTTTAAPTTAAPTAAPTTRAPATRPPTTAAPITTELTIPDVTFSQPTWAGTEDP